MAADARVILEAHILIKTKLKAYLQNLAKAAFLCLFVKKKLFDPCEGLL